MSFSDIWAGMLNNRAKRGSKQVLEHIGITEGDVIADIGSGGGFFYLCDGNLHRLDR